MPRALGYPVTCRVASLGRSEFLRVSGLRLHVRRFGRAEAPWLFLLHGWLDASASFGPLIEHLLPKLAGCLNVVVPDWRGHGYSQWAHSGYWFPDYVADLEGMLDHYAVDQVMLIGHSMGAHVAALYAGLRPRRIRSLACLDAFNLPNGVARTAPHRYQVWLDQLRDTPKCNTYPDFETLAKRIMRNHPRLTLNQARFVAQCWAAEDGHGEVRLLVDPGHRLRSPNLHRAAEWEAIWRQITAPTLLLSCAESEHRQAIDSMQRKRRYACFRNRQVEVLPKVGHMLHFEAPQMAAERLAAFLSVT